MVAKKRNHPNDVTLVGNWLATSVAVSGQSPMQLAEADSYILSISADAVQIYHLPVKTRDAWCETTLLYEK